MKTLQQTFAVTAMLIIACALSGCTTMARPEKMVAQAKTSKSFTRTASITVLGGDTKSQIDRPNFSNENLKAALQRSIEECKLFTQVVNVGGADYHLEVLLMRVTPPPKIAINITAEVMADWKLKRVGTGDTVLQETITGTYTATIGDAFAGAARARIAYETAARKNIERGLQMISDLNL